MHIEKESGERRQADPRSQHQCRQDKEWMISVNHTR
jgi:hypothetical protein